LGKVAGTAGEGGGLSEPTGFAHVLSVVSGGASEKLSVEKVK
jgi:hypothetical protein